MLRKRASVSALLACLGLLAAPLQACTASTTPVGSSGTNRNDLDAGNGLCGAAACAPGQLCCAGADAYCSPTCITVATCPVYGRACVLPTSDAGAGVDAAVADAAPPASLQWYTTCGDPVCQSPADGGSLTNDAGAACPAVGTTCSGKGVTCGARSSSVDCGAIEVCDDHDPKSLGCPISSRKFKNDIAYVDDEQLAELHDDTMRMRLATYEYKSELGDPTEKHLGFIIEDQPQSLSVDRGHDRIDMYGYLSMLVATMQVQEKEIAALRRELAATRSRPLSSKPREAREATRGTRVK